MDDVIEISRDGHRSLEFLTNEITTQAVGYAFQVRLQ